MTWTLRDMHRGRPTPREALPQPEFHDDEPLPFHAYFAGMDEGDEDAAPPGWGALRVVSEEQGLWSTQQLERFSWLMRRGVDATHDDPKSPVPCRRSAHLPPTGYTPGGVPNE